MKITRIYCDMDGVLADFDRAKEYYFGKHMDDDQMWSEIRRDHPDWFANLLMKKHARRLWNQLNLIAPVTVLTATPKPERNVEGVAEQKTAWIRRHISLNCDIITCLGVEKQEYAFNGNLLVDDSGRNVGQWMNNGGIGILHNSVGETLACLKELI